MKLNEETLKALKIAGLPTPESIVEGLNKTELKDYNVYAERPHFYMVTVKAKDADDAIEKAEVEMHKDYPDDYWGAAFEVGDFRVYNAEEDDE